MNKLLSLALAPLLLVSCATSDQFRSEVHVWPNSAASQPQTAETRLALSKQQAAPNSVDVHGTFVDVHTRLPQRISATVPGDVATLRTSWVSSDRVRLSNPRGVVLEFRRDGSNKWSAYKASQMF